MTNEFKDITIISLNEDLSNSTKSLSPRMRIVLILSSAPPAKWVTRLGEMWGANYHSLKADVNVSTDRLSIVSTPEEFENTYYQALKNLVAQTNEYYRQFLDNERRTMEAKMVAATGQKAKLLELKKMIELDTASKGT